MISLFSLYCYCWMVHSTFHIHEPNITWQWNCLLDKFVIWRRGNWIIQEYYDKVLCPHFPHTTIAETYVWNFTFLKHTLLDNWTASEKIILKTSVCVWTLIKYFRFFTFMFRLYCLNIISWRRVEYILKYNLHIVYY